MYIYCYAGREVTVCPHNILRKKILQVTEVLIKLMPYSPVVVKY